MGPVSAAALALVMIVSARPALAGQDLPAVIDQVVAFACSPQGHLHVQTLASTLRLAATASYEARAQVLTKVAAACPQLKQAYEDAAWAPRLGPRRGQSSGVSRPPDAGDPPDD